MKDSTTPTADVAKSRRTRVSKPKVRTGCITCKLRRLKCDESKPECLRCKKAGIGCRGYEFVDSRPSRGHQPIQILPRPDPTHLLILQPYSENEGRYVSFFLENTVLGLSIHFDSNFWTSVVLRDSYASEGTRHALLALGALSKTIQTLGLAWDISNVYSDHHRFALDQYAKAIKTLKTWLTRSKTDRVSALVSCILLMCFEAMQGNHASVTAHVHSGVELFSSMPPSRDERMREIKQMFARLSIQSYFTDFPRCLVQGGQLAEYDSTDSLIASPVFASVSEARIEWDFLMNRVVNLYQRSIQLRAVDPLKSLFEDMLHEHQKCSVMMQRWETAFRQLRQTYLMTPAELKGVRVMQLYHHFAIISLAATLHPEETIFDEYTDDFKAILSLSQSLARELHNEPRFSFDVGIVVPLSLMAAKCRIESLRKEAISLLYSSGRREGMWDGVLAARICEWISSVEKAGMDEYGYIPEVARLRISSVDYNVAEHSLRVNCKSSGISNMDQEFTVRW